MHSRFRQLRITENLFIKFLAITQASELDFNIPCSTQVNHALGKLHNSYRFPHVEDKNLAALPHCSSLKHQLTCFRNQHKEAYDFRMSHRHGSSLSNLLFEELYNRPIRSKHIAKSSRHKLCDSRCTVSLQNLLLTILFTNRPIKTLTIDFTDTLRTPHHIRGVHRLIRGNHHKLLRSVLHGKVSYHTSSTNVILHSHPRIILHHRHVLIRCCMEHIVRPVFRENLLHTFLVCDTCHDGLSCNIRMFFSHFQTNIMHRSLSLIHQYQFGRFKFSHLSNHLTSDRPSSTCNEDILSMQQISYHLHIHLNLVSWQQILNVHLMQSVELQMRTFIPRLSRREHHDFYSSTYQSIYQSIILTEAV